MVYVFVIRTACLSQPHHYAYWAYFFYSVVKIMYVDTVARSRVSSVTGRWESGLSQSPVMMNEEMIRPVGVVVMVGVSAFTLFIGRQ